MIQVLGLVFWRCYLVFKLLYAQKVAPIVSNPTSTRFCVLQGSKPLKSSPFLAGRDIKITSIPNTLVLSPERLP